MYEIRPDSIKQFINDRSIQLPRFQRKQTWDAKKNFQLVISIFKDYPMGVCIISKERIANKTVTYLLDGRQRRNVFKLMYENPENICIWAKKYMGYKNSTTENELKTIFDEKIGIFLEEDEEADQYDSANEQEEELPDDFEQDSNERNYGSGLDLLFKIISTFYKTSSHYTGFSEPFDFTKYFVRIPYVDQSETNTYVINGTKLKNYIDEYRKDCEINNNDYESIDVFCNYLFNRCSIKTEGQDENKARKKFKEIVQARWQRLLLRIDLVDEIDKTLNSAKIGIIEVSAMSSADSQKIFNIINSEGVKLTAAEVLSASARWNRKLNNPSGGMQTAAREMYSNMDIAIDDVVRWDVPATLLSRLGKNPIFKDLSWDSKANKAEFEKKVTLGFKIFAGIFKKRVTKDDIAALGEDNSIDWDTQSEDLLRDLKNMCQIISNISYFKVLSSWQTTVMAISSDSIALDFLFEMYFDWKRKGSPIGNSTQTAKFQKNCIILLDQLIYEYINLQWRGSSDSKIAQNIGRIDERSDIFVPIARNEWEKTLNNIRTRMFIDDSKEISYKLMAPLLYHAYCLNNMLGPVDAHMIDVDHIIPQKIFKQSALPRKEIIQDSLFNLALLPKKENIQKGDNRLKDVEDQWLKSYIVTYECIPENMFEEFSNVNNYQELFDYRKQRFFDQAFGDSRDNILNN